MTVNEVLGVEVFNCQRRADYHTGRASIRPAEASPCSLAIITGGRAVAVFRTRKYRIGRNAVLFWTQNALTEIVPDPSYSYRLLSFRCLTSSAARGALEILPACSLLKSTREAVRLHDAIYRKFHGRAPGGPQECSLLAVRLLRAISAGSKPDRERRLQTVGGIDHRIRATLKLIHDRIKEPLRISRLAQGLGMHPVHFTRLFKQATGFSPQRYILDKKIEKAKDIITHADDNPAAAALELGFHDYAHFSRTFKKITGLSPSKHIALFREEIGPG